MYIRGLFDDDDDDDAGGGDDDDDYYYYAPPLIDGGIKRCLTSVCLTSVAYIGPVSLSSFRFRVLY